MKNKIFYYVCAAFMLYSMSVFTSCSDDPEAPTEEQPGDKDDQDDENKDDEEDGVLNLNGTYSEEANADGTLAMTYNGGELTGKSVTFLANEDGTSATVELAGMTKDLTDMIGGLMPWSLETYSPIPGQKTVTLSDVALTPNEDGTAYTFTASDEEENAYKMSLTGTVEEGKMTMDITYELVNSELEGNWWLAKINTANGGDHGEGSAPLFYHVKSDVEMNLGKVSFVTLKGNLDGLLSVINTMGALFLPEVNGVKGLENYIYGVLARVDAAKDGSMLPWYEWSNNWKPAEAQYSCNMPANSLRYYYGEGNTLYLEINPDVIINLVSGLVNPTAISRSGDPEATKAIGRQLIEKLNPVLASGLPCTYELDGDNLKIWLDETWTLDVFKILADLVTDEYASGYIAEFLPTLGLGDMTNLVENLLGQLPYVVNYGASKTMSEDGESGAKSAMDAAKEGKTKEEIEEAGGLTGTCEGIRLGLKLTKVMPDDRTELTVE